MLRPSSEDDGADVSAEDDADEAELAGGLALRDALAQRRTAAPPPPQQPPAAAAPAPGGVGAAAAAAATAAARQSPASAFSRNGASVPGRYLWSQSSDEAVLSVLVPPGTRARDLEVRLVRDPQPTTAAAPTGRPPPPRVVVRLRGAVVLDERLAHDVEEPLEGGAGNDEGGGAAAAPPPPDWEVVDFDANNRAVRLALRKRSPGHGVVLWWDSCLAGCGEARLDTAALADRRGADGRGAQRAEAARAAWAEAEAAFRLRVQQDRALPVEVDADDD